MTAVERRRVAYVLDPGFTYRLAAPRTTDIDPVRKLAVQWWRARETEHRSAACRPRSMMAAAPTTVAPARAPRQSSPASIHRWSQRLQQRGPFPQGRSKTLSATSACRPAVRKNRANTQRAAYLLTDDDAAKRRRQHHVGRQRAHTVRDRGTTRLGLGRMLQHECTLQITGTVESRCQPEMSVEQRTDASKPIEHAVVAMSAAVTMSSYVHTSAIGGLGKVSGIRYQVSGGHRLVQGLVQERGTE